MDAEVRAQTVETDGLDLCVGFVDAATVGKLIYEIEALESVIPTYGIRNAEKKIAAIRDLVNSTEMRTKAEDYLTGSPQLVRAIVFDKTPDKNWYVTWHQDKTIAVDRKASAPGWGPWSIKDGVHHVQPGVDVLNDTITFRIHLDPADESNGCLRVIPGSHKRGILKKSEITKMVDEGDICSCTAQSGDMLIMRPHLLHASSRAQSPNRRRVVHIDYSSYQLPANLNWI